MRACLGAVLTLALALAGTPLLAHHTIAWYYDTDRPVTLSGIVTGIDWQNPHVILHLNARNADGSVLAWDVETRAVYQLRRQGLDRDFVRAGDAVTMTVFVSKDGMPRAAAQTITLPSGTTANVSMLQNQAPR